MRRRNLENYVVIVTGASSGIGRETALLFAKQRCHVVLAARRKDRLDELAAEARGAGGDSLVVQTDVSDEEQVKSLIHQTVARFGRVDILVNNAGFGLFAKIEDTTVEELQTIFATNFLGTFHAIKAILPIMQRQNQGHIINISSVAGKRAFPLSGAYCATKFAMNGLTESLRTELRESRIDVSLVLPVGTATDFFAAAKNKSNRPSVPLGIVQSAQQVAHAIMRCAVAPRPEVYVYFPSRILVLLNSVSPRLVDWLGAKLVRQAEDKGAKPQ